MYKYFLTLRYLRKKRIAIFAVVSVWLCVAMEVIVISVMGGFLDTLKERSRGLLSDIVVDNQTLVGFPHYDEFGDHLKRTLPDVVAEATPVIYNYGIIKVAGESFTKPVRVVGIRLHEYEAVNDFKNSLFYDKYYPDSTSLKPQYQPFAGYSEDDVAILPPDLEEALARWKAENPNADELDDWERGPGVRFPGPGAFRHLGIGPPGYETGEGELAPGVIVGANILNQRNRSGGFDREFQRGSKLILTVLPLSGSGNLSAAGATTAVLRFADDSRTRVYEIDNMCVYVDFELLQEWLSMGPVKFDDGAIAPARASQVLVSLRDGVDLAEARDMVAAEWTRFLAGLDVLVSDEDIMLLDYVTIETWEQRQVQFIAAVEKEKILVTLLFGVISLVAVVLIGCIFWMIVYQKTRDIGLIKSIGASASGVAGIFVAFGLAVGIAGAALGAGTGAAFVWNINDIQAALESLHPQLRVWSPDVYTFDMIPSDVKWHEVMWICVVAVAASVLGALIPATIAARVWPVSALRYE